MSRQYSVVPTHENEHELTKVSSNRQNSSRKGRGAADSTEERSSGNGLGHGSGSVAIAVDVDVDSHFDTHGNAGTVPPSSSPFALSPPSRLPPALSVAHSASSSPRNGGGLDSATSSFDADESTALVPHSLDDRFALSKHALSTHLQVDADGDGGSSEPDEEQQQEAADGASSSVAGLVVLDASPPGAGEVTVTLMRLGGTGLGNVQLNAPLSSTVGQLAARAYEREQREERLRVRLLFMGRMLRDDETLGAAGVTSGCVLHAHLTTMAPEGGEAAAAGDGSSSAAPADGEVLMDGEGGASGLEGIPGNYTAAQLQQMRLVQLQYEAAMHGGGGPPAGTNAEFLLGFFLGFVLGFLSIIWLYSPSLSRKQRLGILLGLLVNLLMALNNWMEPQRTAQTEGDGTADGGAVMPPMITDPRDGAQGITNWR